MNFVHSAHFSSFGSYLTGFAGVALMNEANCEVKNEPVLSCNRRYGLFVFTC